MNHRDSTVDEPSPYSNRDYAKEMLQQRLSYSQGCDGLETLKTVVDIGVTLGIIFLSGAEKGPAALEEELPVLEKDIPALEPAINKAGQKLEQLGEKLKEGAAKAEVPQKVIGHYPEYVDMSNKLGTKPFSIPDNIWNRMTPAEQWTANQKFLDRAIAKSSEFNLATPADKVRPGSYLQKEIEYLTSQGYKLSSDGTKLVK